MKYSNSANEIENVVKSQQVNILNLHNTNNKSINRKIIVLIMTLTIFLLIPNLISTNQAYLNSNSMKSSFSSSNLGSNFFKSTKTHSQIKNNIGGKNTSWCWTRSMINQPNFVYNSLLGGLNWGFCGENKSDNKVTYLIEVHMGITPDSGSESTVKIRIFGDQGATNDLILSNKGFEPATIKKVELNNIDVGNISKIRLRIDGAQGLFFRKIIITKNSSITVFDNMTRLEPCNGYIRPNSCKVELFNEGNFNYEVTVTTSNERNAGTDVPVYFKIYGERGRTSLKLLNEYMIDDGSNTMVNVFSTDLGEITGYYFKLGGNGTWKPIFLSVKNLLTNTNKSFNLGEAILSYPGKDTLELSVESSSIMTNSRSSSSTTNNIFPDSESDDMEIDFGNDNENFDAMSFSDMRDLGGEGARLKQNFQELSKYLDSSSNSSKGGVFPDLNQIPRLPGFPSSDDSIYNKVSNNVRGVNDDLNYNPDNNTPLNYQLGSMLSDNELSKKVVFSCEQTFENYDGKLGPNFPTHKVNYFHLIGYCPSNCHLNNGYVYGVGIHPEESPICYSAILDKAVSPYGGMFQISVYSGLAKYPVPSNVRNKVGSLEIRGFPNRSRRSYVLSKLDNVDLVEKDIRILDNEGKFTHDGRLEMRVMGEWGTVCFRGMNSHSAVRICKDLGFRFGEWKNEFEGSRSCRSYNSENYCGAAGLNPLMMKINCSVNDVDFNHCSKQIAEDCSHDDDAIIKCTNEDLESGDNIPFGTLRLVGPSLIDGYIVGRLEMYSNQGFFPICDKKFNDVSATIACRQMGYNNGKEINGNTADAFRLDEESIQSFSASEIKCKGFEKVLKQCSMKKKNVKCSHDQDTVVGCVGNGDPSGEKQYKKQQKDNAPNLGKLMFPKVQATCKTSGNDRMFKGDPGSTYLVMCSGDCSSKEGLVWGTGMYSIDSKVCKAAVHAGVINKSGLVLYTKSYGQDYYETSDQKNIESIYTSQHSPYSFSISKPNSHVIRLATMLDSGNGKVFKNKEKSVSGFMSFLKSKANSVKNFLFGSKPNKKSQNKSMGSITTSVDPDLMTQFSFMELSSTMMSEIELKAKLQNEALNKSMNELTNTLENTIQSQSQAQMLNRNTDTGFFGDTVNKVKNFFSHKSNKLENNIKDKINNAIEKTSNSIKNSANKIRDKVDQAVSSISTPPHSSKNNVSKYLSNKCNSPTSVWEWKEPITQHKFSNDNEKIIVSKNCLSTLNVWSMLLSFTMEEFYLKPQYIFSIRGCGGFNIFISRENTLVIGDPCKEKIDTNFAIPLNAKVFLLINYNNKKIDVSFRIANEPNPKYLSFITTMPMTVNDNIAIGSVSMLSGNNFIGKIDSILVYPSEVSRKQVDCILEDLDANGKINNANWFNKTLDGRNCVSPCINAPVPGQKGSPLPPFSADLYQGGNTNNNFKYKTDDDDNDSYRGDTNNNNNNDNNGNNNNNNNNNNNKYIDTDDSTNNNNNSNICSGEMESSFLEQSNISNILSDFNNVDDLDQNLNTYNEVNSILTNPTIILECNTTIDTNNDLKGPYGKKIRVKCPACKNKQFPVFGSYIYHSASSICKSAEHNGIISGTESINLNIIMTGNKEAFNGSTQNGIVSGSLGKSEYSYKIEAASPLKNISCKTTGNSDLFLNMNLYQKVIVMCPENCLLEYMNSSSSGNNSYNYHDVSNTKVYGNSIYADISPICLSAIHDGAITDKGGEVQVLIEDGQDYYQGSEIFGVASYNYGPYIRSFSFLGHKTAEFYEYKEEGFIRSEKLTNNWEMRVSPNASNKSSNYWEYKKLELHSKLDERNNFNGIYHSGSISIPLGNTNDAFELSSSLILKQADFVNGKISLNIVKLNSSRSGFYLRYLDEYNYYSIVFTDYSANFNINKNANTKTIQTVPLKLPTKDFIRVKVFINFNNIQVFVQLGVIKRPQFLFNLNIEKNDSIARGGFAVGCEGETFFEGIEISKWTVNDRNEFGIKQIDVNSTKRSWDGLLNKVKNIKYMKRYCKQLFKNNLIEYNRCQEPHLFCHNQCSSQLKMKIEGILLYNCFNDCVKVINVRDSVASVKDLIALSSSSQVKNEISEKSRLLINKMMMDAIGKKTWIPDSKELIDYLPLSDIMYRMALVDSIRKERVKTYLTIKFLDESGYENMVQEEFPNKRIKKCGEVLSRTDCRK